MKQTDIIITLLTLGLLAIIFQFFALMENMNTLRAIESEQRDVLWCIHESTASGVDMCPPTSIFNQ